MPTLTPVAAYCRISPSDDETETGSIALQRHLAAAHVAARGESPLWYIDEGVTGMTPFEQRPAGARLVEDAKRGLFTKVYVYKLDRLGRGKDSRLILNAVYDLLDIGVQVCSLTESIDTSTPAGQAFLEMLATFASYDRKMILERMRLGKARVARAGQWWGGQPPYGYDLVDKQLVVNDEQAAVVRSLFRRLIEGASCVALAQELNARGIPTGFELRKCKGKRLGHWHDSSVRRILHSDLYTGSHAYHTRGESFPVALPPLVSREEWEAAQAAITRNAIDARRNTRHEYLLRGLLKCGACGWSLCGRTGPRAYAYYRCAGSLNRDKGEPRCNALSVRCDAAERRVWDACLQFLLNPVPLTAAAEPEPEPATDELDELARALAALDAARARVIDLYSRGSVTAEETDAQLVRLAGEKAALESRRRSLSRQSFTPPDSPSLLMLADTIRARLKTDDPPFALRRDIIRLLVYRVTVTAHGKGRMILDADTAWGFCQL